MTDAITSSPCHLLLKYELLRRGMLNNDFIISKESQQNFKKEKVSRNEYSDRFKIAEKTIRI